ncbi:MAG: hypothetical protein R3F59_26875 [Myxococcota bacterium]
MPGPSTSTLDAARASTDGTPRSAKPAAIGWLGQALLLLAWVQRPAAAERLLGAVAAALDRAALLLGLPPVAAAVVAAGAALDDFVADDAAP